MTSSSSPPASPRSSPGCRERRALLLLKGDTSASRRPVRRYSDRGAEPFYIMAVAAAPSHQPGREKRGLRCLACGSEIEAIYSRLGSLRCDDCRLARAPLDPALVRAWRQEDSHT